MNLVLHEMINELNSILFNKELKNCVYIPSYSNIVSMLKWHPFSLVSVFFYFFFFLILMNIISSFIYTNEPLYHLFPITAADN